MSVGVEVDALALMLDGANNEWCTRFDRDNIWFLIERKKYRNPPPIMERAVAYPEWAEVAEAILELEAWADWWHIENDDDRPFLSGYGPTPLAVKAHRHASRYASDEILLEAAARLRDGWRPRSWRKKRITKEKTK